MSGWHPQPINIWVADLSGVSAIAQGGGVAGLRDFGNPEVDLGKRLIRARFPNADPEFGFGSGIGGMCCCVCGHIGFSINHYV